MDNLFGENTEILENKADMEQDVPESVANQEKQMDEIMLKSLDSYRRRTGSTSIGREKLFQLSLQEASKIVTSTQPNEVEMEDALNKLILRKKVKEFVIDGMKYYSKTSDEQNESKLIAELKSFFQREKSLNVLSSDLSEQIKKEVKSEGISLSNEQENAVKTALISPVSIITGGPGCGKTLTANVIIKVAKRMKNDAKIILAAPTGKAAMRLKELTGMPAQTIQSLVEYRPQDDYWYLWPNSISADLLIIDEVSMLDLYFTYRVFYMTAPTTRIILIGDPDQLPSIKAGAVLRDMMNSGIIPVSSLCHCYRQTSGAEEIISVANAIKAQHRIGIFPLPINTTLKDSVHFIQTEQADDIHTRILEVVKQLHADLGYSYKQIQVLTPVNSKSWGAEALNEELRRMINSRHVNENDFWEGDRVICTKNIPNPTNPSEKIVVNGELGEIVSVIGEKLTIQFEKKKITLSAGKVSLAYALSVHRAQGSEYPVVIVPLCNEMWSLLSRPVLYTALTRAKEKVVIIGSAKDIMQAVRTDVNAERLTVFSQRLKSELKSIA